MQRLLFTAFPASEIKQLISNLPSLFLQTLQNPCPSLDLYSYPPCFQLLNGKAVLDHQQQRGLDPELALIHSLCHIEYNAMKAYLDTSLRFLGGFKTRDQGFRFLSDFTRVAGEEATHFEALNGLLKARGVEYGFMPGIDSIRQEVAATKGELLDRIAVLALIQEGKGLDAGPGLMGRVKSGDFRSVLKGILGEEVGHVGNGVKWFKELAGEQARERFKEICTRFNSGKRAGKMNWKEREKAGFERSWLEGD